MKTKKPNKGPAATKGIFGDVVEDLEALEKECRRLDLEITKLKGQLIAARGDKIRIAVIKVEDGPVYTATVIEVIAREIE